MDGLEVTILKLSEVKEENIRFRIDSDFFIKEYLKNELFLKSKFRIKDFSKNKIKTINNFRLKKDFNYLEISGVNLNSLNYEITTINPNEIPDRATYILKHNDIIVSTVRPNRNAVALIKNPKRLIGTSGFTVIRPFNIVPEYLFVFCKTKYFITKLMRENTASMYPAVSDSDVLNVKIPIPSNDFQLKIEQIVKSSYDKLENSKSLYSQAEEILLTELGLKDWQPTEETKAVKSFKDSFLTSGRLDAEYYQPKYEEIEEKIRGYKGGWDIIDNHFIQNNKIIEEDKEGYNYIEIGDINVSNGEVNYNYILKEELPANAKIKVNKNDLLISKVRPYRGAVAIIDFENDNLVASGAFTVLQEKENLLINKETLCILLKISVYKTLMMKNNVGSSYPVIKDEDIKNLTIPILPLAIQQTISQKIQQSFKLRKESKDLLELAKKMVEEAIENGEEN